MAEMDKLKGNDLFKELKHIFREIPASKRDPDSSIQDDLSEKNYSLLNRCNSTSEALKYKKNLLKKIFKYNRKDVVEGVEWVVQSPKDLNPNQKEDFFRAVHDYICGTLPMGEECVLSSVVHVDERHYDNDGNNISKDHLHFVFMPAMPDLKHDDYDFKLNAHDLCSKKYLYEFHPGLQKYLDERGIKCTVFDSSKSGQKKLKLTHKQMKEFTAATGIVLEGSVTPAEFAKLLEKSFVKNKNISRETKNQLREFLR